MKERYTEEDIAKDGYFERVEDAVNPEEIIEEVMQANKKYFDKILVIDGSNDKTEEIILNMNPIRLHILAILGPPFEKIYSRN